MKIHLNNESRFRLLKFVLPGLVIIGLAFFLWPRVSHDTSPFAFVKGETTGQESALPFVKPAYPIPVKVGTSAQPEISARSAIVVDRESGEVLYEKNADEVMPIASLSKLVSLPVFMKRNPGWDMPMSLTTGENALVGAKLREPAGEEMSVYNVFRSALVGSVNNGTWALMRVTGLTQEQFAAEMNQYVRGLGLTKSFFEEPTGLSDKNVSTAREFVEVVKAARKVPEITEPLQQKTHDFYTITNGHFHSVKTSNKIYDQGLNVVLSKTGYTDEAYYTLASIFRGPNEQELIVVTFGNDTDQSRMADNVNLVDWALAEFEWKR